MTGYQLNITRDWKKSALQARIRMNFAKPRVNASKLPSLRGSNVCLLGKVKNVANDGNSFVLTTSDDQDVRVVLQEPLNEYVAGLTEVHGQVDGQNNILCSNYIVFPSEISQNFDLKAYNEAVEMITRNPELYVQGVQQ